MNRSLSLFPKCFADGERVQALAYEPENRATHPEGGPQSRLQALIYVINQPFPVNGTTTD